MSDTKSTGSVWIYSAKPIVLPASKTFEIKTSFGGPTFRPGDWVEVLSLRQYGRVWYSDLGGVFVAFPSGSEELESAEVQPSDLRLVSDHERLAKGLEDFSIPVKADGSNSATIRVNLLGAYAGKVEAE